MADRVVLHVGAPKSGTTFLQTLLWHHRDRLAEDGVLLPGRRLFDQNRASSAIRGGGATGKRSPARLWARMQEQIATWDGTALVTNEWLTLADADQAQAAVSALAPARVEVVFTARDVVGQAPAGWQETLKLGAADTLDDFLAGLEGTQTRWGWHSLDPVEVLPRWRGAHRVHVVTVPASSAGPHVLWERFAQVLGVAPDAYHLQVAQANESLSAEAAALLQRLGPLVRTVIDAEGGHWTEPYTWIRRYLAHELLVPRRGSPLGLRPDQRAVLREHSQRIVARLSSTGYSIVGDLDDLVSAEPPVGARIPAEVSDGELLALLLPVTVDVMQRLRGESRRVDSDARHAEQEQLAED